MGIRRSAAVAALAVGLVAGATVPVGAAEPARSAPVAAVAEVAEVGAVPAVVQQDLGGLLWGFLLQVVGGGFVDSGLGVMNSAIDSGAGGLFWYQVGRGLFDFGCALGREGERLAPPPVPNFPFTCTLAPPWPY